MCRGAICRGEIQRFSLLEKNNLLRVINSLMYGLFAGFSHPKSALFFIILLIFRTLHSCFGLSGQTLIKTGIFDGKNNGIDSTETHKTAEFQLENN